MPSSGNILFVTGTDTGIGKTFTSSLLIRALRKKGIQVSVAKPVETGCVPDENGDLIANDARILHESAGSEQSMDEVVPYRFLAPAAPNVAADLENQKIDCEALCEQLRELASRSEVLLIEGAGGLMVPLLDEYTFADLCKDLEATALLLIASRLGCINHALLSLEVLYSRKIPIAGYVINDLFASELSAEKQEFPEAMSSNRERIARSARAYSAEELLFLPHLGEKASIETPEMDSFSEAIIEYFGLSR